MKAYNLVSFKEKSLEYIYNAKGKRTVKGLCLYLGTTQKALEEQSKVNKVWLYYIEVTKYAMKEYNRQHFYK